MQALDESVIIETFARRKGEEIFSESGFVIGKELHGEVPEWGIVVSRGPMCQGLTVGDIVLIPNGRITHVPDPQVVDGKLPKGDLKARQLITTHWKNLQVKYGNKNA